MDLPYEILSGDYTSINYSTSKASRNDFAMFLVPHQFRAEQHLIRPVFRRWLDCEALTQDYLPGYWQDKSRYQRAMWIPAGMPSVDPLRDGKAQIDGINAGILSPQMVILGDGRDPEEVVEQRAAWARLCAAHGIDATTGAVSTSLANNPAKLALPKAPKNRRHPHVVCHPCNPSGRWASADAGRISPIRGGGGLHPGTRHRI